MLIYLSAGNSTFVELFPPSEKEEAQGTQAETPQATGFVHLCLHVDDIRKTVVELKERGLPIKGEPSMGKDGSIQFWVTDPDGNRVELMQIMPGSLQAKLQLEQR